MTMTSPGSRSPTAPIRHGSRGRRPGGRSDDADEGRCAAPAAAMPSPPRRHRIGEIGAAFARRADGPVGDPPQADACCPGRRCADGDRGRPPPSPPRPPALHKPPRTRNFIFRPDDGEAEHYAVRDRRPHREQPVLARLHSACFTGDVLGSLKCDCGPQLHAALNAMGQEGEGVLLYLDQRGAASGWPTRCAPMPCKIRASTQSRPITGWGSTTMSATSASAPASLRRMGFGAVADDQQPAQGRHAGGHGIRVAERVPPITPRNRHNTGYLDVKARKSGASAEYPADADGPAGRETADSCGLGRGGISAHKHRGDGATPMGAHRILGAVPARPAGAAQPMGAADPAGDLWCDASDQPDYNQHVRAPFAASHEAMRRP